MEVHALLKMFMSIVFIVVFGMFVCLYKVLVMEPRRVRLILRKQGIDGPPPRFLLGNLKEFTKPAKQPQNAKSITKGQLDHNWINTLYPCFEQWRKKYGNLFMFSLGNTHVLYVNKASLVNEISTCMSLDLGRPSYHRKDFGPLLGDGILTSNGPTWAHHRKVLAPELFMEKVKGMTNLISESVEILVESWKSRIDCEGGIADIDIEESMRCFSGDVISRACFGSNYAKGKEIFHRLNTLQEAIATKVSSLGIPGTSYIPTKGNREMWKLEKEIRGLILQVVKERKEKGSEKDLLQMVVESTENGKMNNNNKKAMDEFIVDNCKNIYSAANEATAIIGSWCLMLLATYPEWQTRVRDEVSEICHGTIPDNDMLHKMKQLTMVLQETQRLYPTGPALSREALKDMTLDGINIPKGVSLWTMMATIHTDPEIWGADALSFKPERFANGISGACKLPHSFLPFGFGPRICVGRHLAMVELKMLIAAIVSDFSFTVSPKYVHSPTFKFLVKPGYGVNLLIKRV